jgi:transposase
MTGYRRSKISGSMRPPANVAKVANDRSAAGQTLATLASLAGGAAGTRIGGYQSRDDRIVKGDNKTIIMGMVERGGNLRTGPIVDTTLSNLEKIVVENEAPGSTISTDEWAGYNALSGHSFDHGRVNHSAKEYVRGIHHVNTLEGHWSLFKRAVRGTHVHISAKHSWKYAAEFSYRRNFRHSHMAMIDRLVSSFALPRLQDD